MGTVNTLAPKKQCLVQLLIGGGHMMTFRECELEDNIFPDLTFTGRQVTRIRLREYSTGDRKRFVTTAPYLITHELEGK